MVRRLLEPLDHHELTFEGPSTPFYGFQEIAVTHMHGAGEGCQEAPWGQEPKHSVVEEPIAPEGTAFTATFMRECRRVQHDDIKTLARKQHLIQKMEDVLVEGHHPAGVKPIEAYVLLEELEVIEIDFHGIDLFDTALEQVEREAAGIRKKV